MNAAGVESPREHHSLLVEVTRGAGVESLHHVHAVVCDSAGACLEAWGEAARPVFPRSAVKPIQALALVESGAIEEYGLSEIELALACASHGGQPAHIAAVRAVLERCGFGEDDLECGPHAPLHGPSARALWAAGKEPSAIHNNCSGQHAGLLAMARTMGAPSRGYTAAEHPVQVRIAEALSDATGCDLDDAARAGDGCGIPTFAVPLAGLARAAARLADPAKFAPTRRRAMRRVAKAMTSHPFMVGGEGRPCSEIARLSEGAVLVKTGAEGVFIAALRDRGIGLALKVEDGAMRAAGVALAALLRHLEAPSAAIEQFLEVAVADTRGAGVGVIRAAVA